MTKLLERVQNILSAEKHDALITEIFGKKDENRHGAVSHYILGHMHPDGLDYSKGLKDIVKQGKGIAKDHKRILNHLDKHFVSDNFENFAKSVHDKDSKEMFELGQDHAKRIGTRRKQPDLPAGAATAIVLARKMKK